MIESVPNVSEGRNRATIEEIASAVRHVGVRLLDVHSDVDHNRSVFTFVGGENDVAEAALSLCRVAVRRIDLGEHRGTHPRMGAVDVVPFVPLNDVSMPVCVQLATETGRRIAEELGVAVYLYGECASRPGRANLAEIRRGGFERFGEKITNSEWAPDFGPKRVHPMAGVVAVGARPFLVAYNVVLDTSDVEAAQRIARAVRERDGGLPGVKALGMMLESRGLAQVSMNLTNVRATTVLDAFEAVCHEAACRGIEVRESEIVGLVPRAALGGATEAGIRLVGSLSDRVLEVRMASS